MERNCKKLRVCTGMYVCIKDNFTLWPTCLMCSRNCFLSPVYLDEGGPLRIELACFLSSSSEDRHRAKTISPITVTGIPYSRLATAVHFPVPFCPAESRIFSNRYEPVELPCRPLQNHTRTQPTTNIIQLNKQNTQLKLSCTRATPRYHRILMPPFIC
jgi:hypothetical protein